MNLCFLRGYSAPNSTMFLKRPLSRKLHQSIQSSSRSPLPTSQKVQVPLFLRPPIHTATMSEMETWHDWAKSLASYIGSKFVDIDNGPDSSLLCRELKWLMEDVVEDRSLSSHLKFEKSQRNVHLRVGLEELYKLWSLRIKERRPFQYIVGCEHWRDLVLCVQEGVLIPRPETGQIVDMVADVISDNEGLKEGLWADLGTGSGALAIGVGMSLRNCSGRLIATDISSMAVAVAAFNVQRYSLQNVVELRQGSWFEPLKDVRGKLAGIISNPPYIPSDHISGLQAEVGKHEPIIALDGGTDGMSYLLHLCRMSASMLRPGGYFAFETNGEKQCRYLAELMETDIGGNFYNLSIVPDFAGIHRFVTGFRK